MEDEAATLSSLDDELIMHIVLLDDMWRDVKSQRRGGPEPFDSVIYTLAQTCRRFAVLAHTRRPKRSRLREVGMLTKRMANFAHLIHVHRDREGHKGGSSIPRRFAPREVCLQRFSRRGHFSCRPSSPTRAGFDRPSWSASVRWNPIAGASKGGVRVRAR